MSRTCPVPVLRHTCGSRDTQQDLTDPNHYRRRSYILKELEGEKAQLAHPMVFIAGEVRPPAGLLRLQVPLIYKYVDSD